MKTKILLTISILLLLVTTEFISAQSKENKKIASSPKVTFIELGSVNCIPCKQMQPVMKAVEKKYGDQVKVIFYDVWTQEQRPYADKYRIKLIPTQVFLDEKGKEFFRHEGFFPEAEIDKILQGKGLKIKKG